MQFQTSIQNACDGRPALIPDFGDLAAAQAITAGEGNPAERTLLQSAGELLCVLRTLSIEDRHRIRKLLDTIIHGQESDLARFHQLRESPAALQTDEELDRYTYDVAGCVGEFWTEMCRSHVFPTAPIDGERLLHNGVLFGKGLQLVNILRDLPRDLRRGRCYIPLNLLADSGLTPKDLLDREMMDRFRPLYDAYLGKATACLAAGWEYTLALPYRCPRIRLACAWPLLIGVRTLRLLRTANVLDDRDRAKIGRADIRRLMLRTALLYPNTRAWNRLFKDYESSD